MQVTSNLKQHVTIKESIFRLGVLSGLPPLSLINMLHVIGGGFGV
jgi:hypothetical protein